MKAAVGAATCDPCQCDVDNSGGANPVTATDALRILRRAVGLPIALSCPSRGGPSCYEQSAPTCNGSCPTGLTCGPSLLDPGACKCLTECERGTMPACGGSCSGAEGPPGQVCMIFRIFSQSSQGVPVREGCVCAPPDAKFCSYASAPACAGVCPSGRICIPDGGGGCVCEAQPLQPPCGAAQSPTCAGTCNNGFLREVGAASAFPTSTRSRPVGRNRHLCAVGPVRRTSSVQSILRSTASASVAVSSAALEPAGGAVVTLQRPAPDRDSFLQRCRWTTASAWTSRAPRVGKATVPGGVGDSCGR